MNYAVAKSQQVQKEKIIEQIKTGDIIKVKSDLSKFIFHYGIVCKDGTDFFVYHNDPYKLNFMGGSIIRENFNDWIQNKEIAEVIPTNLNVNDIEKATAALKTYKYHIFDFNCEHFVSKLKDKKPSSPQIANWALLISSIILAGIIIRKSK